MSIKLECSLDEIRKALAYLGAALPKRICDRNDAMLEIFFLPQEIRLSVIGAVYKMLISTGVYQKVILPFILLERITSVYPNKNFVIYLDENSVTFDGKTLKRDDIMFVDPECQHTIELTMNFSDRDLLILEYLYPNEDLKRMKLEKKIDEAKENFENAVQNAADYLYQYGVKYEDVLTLAMSKIIKKKFCF